MTRLLQALVVAFAIASAAPAIAADCPGDCTKCPHKAAGAKADKPGTDAASCACAGGKECKCGKGCKCDHCSKKTDEKAPKAPSKS
jgi:hypothetical protein